MQTFTFLVIPGEYEQTLQRASVLLPGSQYRMLHCLVILRLCFQEFNPPNYELSTILQAIQGRILNLPKKAQCAGTDKRESQDLELLLESLFKSVDSRNSPSSAV